MTVKQGVSINHIFRFILEVLLLLIVGKWGFGLSEGWTKYFVASGLPLALAIIWGVFAVPGDPSRSGKTVIVTRGWIRLIMELSMFGFAGWCFLDLELYNSGAVFIFSVALHYVFDYSRVKWLLRQ